MSKILFATAIVAAMFAGAACFAADDSTSATVAPATNGTTPADSITSAPSDSMPAPNPGTAPTMDEKLDKAMTGFDSMDSDHDGAVSKTEFRAALEKSLTLREATHGNDATSASTDKLPDASPSSGSGVSAGQ